MKGKIKDELRSSSTAILAAISGLRNMLNNVWQRMKSKSNDLESTAAGLCLLVCGIFPDDSRIPVQDLVAYGMGLSLFHDVHNISEARCRVYDLIKTINDSKYPPKVTGNVVRLAHEEDRPDFSYVKMLVGARDLAKSVASTYTSVFHREIITEKWPESNGYKDCYGISLVLKKVKEYHANLEFPKLALLQLQYGEDSQTIPVGFFEGMKQLCVLSLDVPSLPQALDVLRNLRTLHLKALKFEDMSSIGGLISLEFLSISVLSLTDIPREIGRLENLRSLDVREMNIQYIPPNVLSRLLKLEELYLPLSFKKWGCKAKKHYDDLGEEDNYDDEERISANISEINDEERINASLSEIISLSLNVLQISVPEASVLPKKSLIFENIQEFKILLPNKVQYQSFEKDSTNELQLTGEACDIKESGVCDLMSRTEGLSLMRVRNLKNVICQLEDNGFPRLKKMIIAECDEVEYIVDTTNKQNLSEGAYLFQKLECLHLSMLSNLKRICNGRLTNYQWLPNLSQVNIRFCHKLEYMFPLSIVKESKLKSIEVLDCSQMEGIFYEDNEEDIPLKLFTIEKLELHSLPKLNGLLVNGAQDDTNQHLTTHKVSLITEEDIVSHMEIDCAIPSKFAEKWLQNLKRLKIAFCDAVKVIFLFEENHKISKAFNSLKELELHGLPNLVHIWFPIPPKITIFQNLQLLVLSECNNLYIFSRQVAKLLTKLEKLYVSRCEKMEEIILNEGKEVKGKVVFPRLQHLELQRLPNLRVFSPGIYEIELPLLESLKINQCKMDYFSNGVLRTPMLERIELNGSLCSIIGDLNATMRRLSLQFSYADLKTATRGWRPDTLLGTGDFGEVYKGWFDEKTFAPSSRATGMMLAIKRFNLQHFIGGCQLEVEFLENLSHPNLIKMLGHCWEDKESLIVYEFVERGSLDKHLFTKNRASEYLSWDMRLKIAIGAAQGLCFLHNENVIHSNIKASNILLDRKYNAKLSDYGLDIPWWLSDECGYMDSYGYAAPESLEGHSQEKSDVYSFGVVLLELMTGKKAIDKNRSIALLDMVRGLKPIRANRLALKDIMDASIEGQYSIKAMVLAAELALNCVEYDAAIRPSMIKVLAVLDRLYIYAIEEKITGDQKFPGLNKANYENKQETIGTMRTRFRMLAGELKEKARLML